MEKIEFLDLGQQPITNNFLSNEAPQNEFLYNLRVGYDQATSLVSLMEFIPPIKMFNENYAHRASQSQTMRKAYKELSDNLKKKFKPKSILEIGSNDGVFLENFNNIINVGVEPCKNLAKITNKIGIKTYSEFWNYNLSNKIINEIGLFDIVYSANTVSHIHDLEDALYSISNILNKNGIFILEDPSLLETLKKVSYDQFYDEHAYVFSIYSLNKIIKDIDLEIFYVEKLNTHGGSNRVYFKKKFGNQKVSNNIDRMISEEKELGINKFETYLDFSKKVQNSKKNLKNLFNIIKDKNKKIIGYGATYKSSTVLNYCKIDKNYIEYFIDTTPNKQGKFTPGTHIPIIDPKDGMNETVDFAFLGAWNFRKEIMNKEIKFIDRGGKFITHVPNPRIL